MVFNNHDSQTWKHIHRSVFHTRKLGFQTMFHPGFRSWQISELPGFSHLWMCGLETLNHTMDLSFSTGGPYTGINLEMWRDDYLTIEFWAVSTCSCNLTCCSAVSLMILLADWINFCALDFHICSSDSKRHPAICKIPNTSKCSISSLLLLAHLVLSLFL